MFNTKRLHLRAYRASDLENILSLYNNPHVAPHITHDFVVPRSNDNFDKIIQRLKDSLMFCIVEDLDGGSFVGFSVIFSMIPPKDRNATYGIALLPEFWHQGYGYEVGEFMIGYAFRSLASHRVSITVWEGNHRAIILYKRM